MASYIITRKEIVEETSSIRENPQLMDKAYVKTGILNDADRALILAITKGDHFTKFIADLYAFWKQHHKMDDAIYNSLKEYHNDLVNYNPNLFPVGGLDPMNANAQRPFEGMPHGMDILDICSALRNRRYVLQNYKKIPEIYLRNLRNDIRKPRHQYDMEKVNQSIRGIIGMMKTINQNNRDNAEKIYAKVFSSKNDTFEKAAEYILNIKEYLVSDADSIDELQGKLSMCSHSKLVTKDDKEGVYVVKVGSQSDMEELGCGALWCFATSSDPQWWREYANDDYVYLIYDFKEPRNSPQRMMVKLPSGEYYDMYNEPSEYNYDEYLPNAPRASRRQRAAPDNRPAEPPPIEPVNAQGQYQMQLQEELKRMKELMK